MAGDQDLNVLIKTKNHLGVLRHIRIHKLREPKLVLFHGNLYLKSIGASLSEISSKFNKHQTDRLSVLEQMCFASLDLHDTQMAEMCLDAIQDALPTKQQTNSSSSEGKEREEENKDSTNTITVISSSVRARYLLGHCFEATQDFDRALKIYDGMIEENPANVMALKRKYTISKIASSTSINNNESAREILNKYIEQNQGDPAGWMQLYKDCMDAGDYKGASFALEEVIVSDPLNAKNHVLLAEVYQTMTTSSSGDGGVESSSASSSTTVERINNLNLLKLARKHACLSLEMKSGETGNLRALYVLVSASKQYSQEAASFLLNVVEKNNKSSSKQTNSSSSYLQEEIEDDLAVAKELVKFGAGKLIQIYSSCSKKKKTLSSLSDVVCGLMKQQISDTEK
eukprot:CAMPEP_0178942604 /NCGR_PEP_ID=MMETSP0789-20121207/2088_1 /TAXON_ID=3005 /ORGANISM="Rhizosolenia setigera, Strain CCMP 1694" /LENGTH=398 /DNA_ID=CAMNT_0020622035 /DNA_START=44 /DNA_END=1240 /DNA_ORIENTATION=-